MTVGLCSSTVLSPAQIMVRSAQSKSWILANDSLPLHYLVWLCTNTEYVCEVPIWDHRTKQIKRFLGMQTEFIPDWETTWWMTFSTDRSNNRSTRNKFNWYSCIFMHDQVWADEADTNFIYSNCFGTHLSTLGQSLGSGRNHHYRMDIKGDLVVILQLFKTRY